MPATPGRLIASPVPPERAKREGVRLLTGHFVGRADELGSLERILDELDGGCPGAVEVAGEPGIGKTRLLRNSPLALERAGTWFCPARRRSSRMTCRSRCSSVRWMSRSRV